MVADLNKLPNGISDFDTLRKEQRIYVDKTDLIYKIASNNAQPIIFFSSKTLWQKPTSTCNYQL